MVRFSALAHKLLQVMTGSKMSTIPIVPSERHHIAVSRKTKPTWNTGHKKNTPPEWHRSRSNSRQWRHEGMHSSANDKAGSGQSSPVFWLCLTHLLLSSLKYTTNLNF
uniref:(northern house mosquito) hypothetical protein n=1 Tax=Culex pipiens TaxID=7175 RepID=A0A8D7ZUJ4_CULPI